MNMRVVLKLLGTVLLWESILMIPSLMISIVDNSYEINAFIISIIIIGVLGFAMMKIKTNGLQMRNREGFAGVAICWVVISLLGALPFYISGAIPSYIDAVFETVSGFTTTGSSILTDIEALPRGILFWRSFTHWIGGMGVLILTLALMPSLGARSVFLMRAESPGPSPGKLVPKISETAKLLYIIYAAMTVIEIVLLIIAKMPIYDAFIHAFGTAGTGGFSNRGLSVGAYNSDFIDWIITIFMLLFGVNFTLHYLLLKGDWRSVLKNEELRLYLIVVLISIIIICVNVLPLYNYSVIESLTQSSFQVASIVTTTGYATTDYNFWPMLPKAILLVLMFFGACAGSTGGGIKFIRILLLFKAVTYEVRRTVHPNSIGTIKVDGRKVDISVMTSIMIFFFAYVATMIVAILIVSLDNFDFSTTFSAVLATISNIGPGLEVVGPMGNFSEFSVLSKIVLTCCMIIGRLELMPIFVLMSPSIWKKR
nr:TrkH family potassium uptake protein [Sedimentibacter sp.]